MSCYETHVGSLKFVGNNTKESLYNLLDQYAIPYKETDDLEDLFYSSDLIYENYIVVNNKIYKWLYHERTDECSDICICTPNRDGTINIVSQFYNGGTCLEETLSEDPVFK